MTRDARLAFLVALIGATAAITSAEEGCSTTGGGRGAGGDAGSGPTTGDAAGPPSGNDGGRDGAPVSSADSGGTDAAASLTGEDAGAPPSDAGSTPARCNGSVHSSGGGGTFPTPPAITVPAGFVLQTVAVVSQARELAALPNGDLLVGTTGTSVYLVPNAESATPGAPVTFATIADAPVQGVAFYGSSCTVGIATQHGLYTVPYTDGQTTADAGAAIMTVRSGPTAHEVDASVDTDTHTTSSVAFSAGKVYLGVGSSCNACVEVDSTRATIQQANLDGSAMTTKATRFRNAIAFATNPVTGTVWAGGAGQDDLVLGHPFEFFDAVTLHPGVADYGWPDCEENQHPYVTGAVCTSTVQPLVELPAYSTIIGATFYPLDSSLPHAFPASYRGGLFLAAHGSWHTNPDGTYFTPPRVAFVAMNGDAPATPANWSDATAQWTEFAGGFQLSDGMTRIGRPTGVAVGSQGSLFVADDANGYVYRIRPTP